MIINFNLHLSKTSLTAIVFGYFCRMMERCLKLGFCLFTCTVFFGKTVWAQTVEKWNLQKCVEYALKNNISVKQTDLQTKFSALTLKQSKASQLPSFNFSSSARNSFGLSENPTTGILENNSVF